MDTRTEIERELDAIERDLPKIIADHPDEGDRWFAFAARSDVVMERLADDEHDYAGGRIDCMLRKAGLLPQRAAPVS
ncbi:MAG: hypothetical protein ABIR62_15840 [Dokdonella sp.]|uniref:hypothetical protein n=1 Tax=Dokdonella sp. TaxID=2291710 RepID=UPI0032673BE9